METTREWSKRGQTDAAATVQSTTSSGESTSSWKSTLLSSSWTTSKASTTPQTVPPAVDSHPSRSSFQISRSPTTYVAPFAPSTLRTLTSSGLLALPSRSHPQPQIVRNNAGTPPHSAQSTNTPTSQPPSPSTTIHSSIPPEPRSHVTSRTSPPEFRFRPVTIRPPIPPVTDDSDRPDIPQPSNLRPRVPARDRLIRWVPLREDGSPAQARYELSEQDLRTLASIAIHAWSPSTLSMYGSGLLAFHTFCDLRNISERARAPVSSDLLSLFLASIAGNYATSTVTNYYAAVRAWHLIHGLHWNIDDLQARTMLRAAERLAPSSSARPERAPVTLETLARLFDQLDPSVSYDAAVRACAAALFFGIARCGELTVPNLGSFDPKRHVKRSDVRTETHRDGYSVTVIHIPVTKTKPTEGQDICFAEQSGPINPVAALQNHFQINDPQLHEHLFTYSPPPRAKRSNIPPTRVPLTRTNFMTRLRRAATAAGSPVPKGHAFRIGGTLEYLLRGNSFETVRTMGRWESDAFQVYLRKHGQILAPYLQDVPGLQDELIRRTMCATAD